MGNRTVYTDTLGEATAYDYDPADRLITVTYAAVATPYSWSDRGELLSDGMQQYQWDAAGRLAAVSGPANLEVAYAYNGDGQRTRMVVDGVTTTYVVDPYSRVDGVSQVIEEKTAGVETSYLYGLDLMGQRENNDVTYYGHDAQSLRLHLDSSGAIIAAYRYGPFGETIGEEPEGYGYGGEDWQEDVGLLFLRARYYSPQLGRFVSRDLAWGKLNRPVTFHRFIYVLNRPTMLNDPSGMWPPEPGPQLPFEERAYVTKEDVETAGGFREYLMGEEPAMLMARTMWGEGVQDSPSAMRHIGWIIKIRAEALSGYPDTWNGYNEAILKPHHFGVWKFVAWQPGNTDYDYWTKIDVNLREMLNPETGPGLSMFRTLYNDAQGIMNRPISPLLSTYIQYREDDQEWVVLDSYDKLPEPEENSFPLPGDPVHSYHDKYDPDDWLAYPIEPPPCWLPWY